MSSSNEKIKEILRENGLKSTMTRVALYQSLEKWSKPASHSDLVEDLGQGYGDQATIYRNLLAFADKGLTRIVSNIGGIARYELIREGDEKQHIHPHFVCGECGEVSCLPKTTVISQLDEQWSGLLKEAQLQFVGRCFECRD